MCKHWEEREDGHGGSQEYCRSAKLSCACCGEKEQCDYPIHYEEVK